MMWKKASLTLLLAPLFLSTLLLPQKAQACGHDGFYFGLGYEQLFMVTPEHQYGAGETPRIRFGPGYGGNAVLGYDFCGSRWGIQMPFEFARIKLNRAEWVNHFGSSVEAVLHLVEWHNGMDFHLVGGLGWSYLTEGEIEDHSNSAAMTASVGPGMTYYFSRTEKISAALALELPIRLAYYFGDRLSANGTTVIGFPIRLSIQIGF